MSVPVQALAGCQWHTDWGTLDCATRRITSYTYDALGRLASVTEDQDPSSSSDTPLATGYKYDLRGNLDETHLPNGVIEDYVYDELNRLDTLTHYAPDETPEDLSDNDRLAEFDYTVRTDGKRTAVTETYWLDENEDGTPEPQITEIDWTYDSLGRLTSESIDHFDSLVSQTEWFEYDLVGNRLEKRLDSDFDGTVDEAIAYLYDANDRLTKEEKDADNNGTVDQTTTYGYDGTQQTSKTVFDNSASQTTSEQTFAYDLQGRLLEVVTKNYSGGDLSQHERITYDYDATGIRVSALHELDTNLDLTFDTFTRTEYLVDHHNFTGYQQVIKETVYDDQGNVVETIEYNFGHDEISQTVTEFDGSGNVTSEATHIFGHDGHGSVKVLYDAAAAILQVYTYEAYGQMLAIHNAIAAAVTTGALTSLQYSGEQFDSRIGQQYLRARYYDPNSGRFNRLDPFAGNSQDPQSFHKYLYTHGNPVMGVDPSGLWTISGMLGSIGVSGKVRAINTAAVKTAFVTAARTIGKDIAWAVAKQIAFNAASYIFFQRQLDAVKEELALLAFDLTGIQLPGEVEEIILQTYQVYKFFSEPIGATTDILALPLVRTSILTALGKLPDPIGKYAVWYGNSLKAIRYGKAILGATVGVPLLLEASARLFTATGYPVELSWKSGWQPSLMGVQVAWGAIYPHGSESLFPGMRVVEMAEIVRSMRRAVRQAQASGPGGYEVALREYVREINYLFGWTVTATARF